MRRLIPFHRGTRAALAGLVLIGAAQAAASVLMMGALDAVLSAGEAQRSPWPLVLLAAATAGLTLGRFAERVQGEVLGQGIVHAIRGSLSHHLIGLPPRDGLPARGEILLRFVGDLSAIRSWHVRGVPALVVGLPVLIGGSVGLGLVDWRLGAAVLGPVLVTVAVQGLAAPYLRRAADEARRRRARLAGEITHACDVISSIQSFGRSGKVERALQRRSEALATALIDRARWSGAIRAGAELGAAGMPLCIAAVWATVPGIGAPAAASALVFGAILAPRLRELGRAREYLDLARVADRRIAAFLARPVLDPRAGGPGIARKHGHVILRDVSLTGVIEGVSAEAPPGSRVVLTGPNGAGKSRLLGLIAGLEDPSSGRIVIDGRDVGRRRRSSLRRLVAVAGEGMPLMRGSVAHNIRCGARVDEDEAQRILRICRWDDLLSRLPRGAETRIGAGGIGLSAGQAARIALVRALMRRPLVLILDEIDTALDEEGRAVLDDVLDSFAGTVLIASHDPRLQARCDVRWRLDPPSPPNRSLPEPEERIDA